MVYCTGMPTHSRLKSSFWDQHHPLDPSDSNAPFQYCASFPASIAFSAIFGLITLLHLIQAIHYGKKFCWVIIMASLWEAAGFITRTLTIYFESPTSSSTSSALGEISQLLILLAPLWVNAFAYILLGRMVYYYLPEQKICGIRAQRLALCFVLLDIRYAFSLLQLKKSQNTNQIPLLAHSWCRLLVDSWQTATPQKLSCLDSTSTWVESDSKSSSSYSFCSSSSRCIENWETKDAL